MRTPFGRNKETFDLWLTIAIALFMVLYNLSVQFIDLLESFFAPYSDLPLAEFVTNGLCLWIYGLMWIAYRRWREATRSHQASSAILAGLNPHSLMVIDPERRIRTCNENTEQLFGYSQTELLGKKTDLLYGDRRQIADKPREIYEQLEQVGFHIGLAVGRRKSGESFPLEIVTGTLPGQEGAVLLMRDITERVEAERALRQAKEAAEAAHREKSVLLEKLQQNYHRLKETEKARDDLFHMIVHDMKTPLQVIMGNLELTRLDMKPEWAETLDAYVSEAMSHAWRLVEMVNSLLDISRLESGEMPLRLSPQDLRATGQRALQSLGPLRNGHTIRLEAPDQPLTVHCDPEIILRVMVNLLSNAVKYTPEQSEILITLARNNGHVRVAVKDDGPGIRPEDQARIFEKFGRASRPQQDSRFSSSGLGLTFCKLAVEAHGGRIGVESEPGKGSRFWFHLPATAAEAVLPGVRR